jgi:hypothetical protein
VKEISRNSCWRLLLLLPPPLSLLPLLLLQPSPLPRRCCHCSAAAAAADATDAPAAPFAAAAVAAAAPLVCSQTPRQPTHLPLPTVGHWDAELLRPCRRMHGFLLQAILKVWDCYLSIFLQGRSPGSRSLARSLAAETLGYVF